MGVKRLTRKLTELRATQTILQRAHDYIELNGFDIDRYDAAYVDSPPRCYIGTVRGVAGVNPHPPAGSHWGPGDASAGDGPELVRALKILDSLVKRKLAPDRLESLDEDFPDSKIGRYVEDYGFLVQDQNDKDELQEALHIFRRALTKVYKQIEKAEAQLAEAS